LSATSEIDRLKDVPIFVVLFDVWHRRAGLTRNALHRAMLIADHLGHPVTVLTVGFDPDLEYSKLRLGELGLIDERILIRNLFEDAGLTGHEATDFFAVDPGSERLPNEQACAACDGAEAVAGAEERDADGFRLVTFRSKDRIARRREFYDMSGTARRIECLDGPSQVLHRRLLDAQGRVRAESRPSAQGARSWRIAFYGTNGAPMRAFGTVGEMRTAWLDSFAQSCSESIFQVETGSPLVVKAVRDMTSVGVAKVKVVHSSHLDSPYTYGSPIVERHAQVLKMINDFDAFVLLTGDQLRDVESEFGPRSTLYAIPHDAPVPHEAPQSRRDPLLAVGVGRFVERKNWDQVIRAFSHVVTEVPAARFELWGLGPLEEDYRALIAELGLENAVEIMGHTADPAAVFGGAAFSVLAGIREGFPLVLLESMAVGTPVVAYDGKYGPRDMIRPGVDGLLVPYGEQRQLADAMVSMFRDVERTRKMGAAARDVSTRFSSALCTGRWTSLYVRAVEQRDRRVVLPDLKARVDFAKVGWRALSLRGGLELSGLSERPGVKLYLRPRSTVLGARYLELKTQSGAEGVLRFSAKVDLKLLSSIAEPWDAYLSVGLRNAHEFVRLAAGGLVLKPGKLPTEAYLTKKANLSWRPRGNP